MCFLSFYVIHGLFYSDVIEYSLSKILEALQLSQEEVRWKFIIKNVIWLKKNSLLKYTSFTIDSLLTCASCWDVTTVRRLGALGPGELYH